MDEFTQGISGNSEAALKIAEGLLKVALENPSAKEWLINSERCKMLGRNLAVAVLECAQTLDGGV